MVRGIAPDSTADSIVIGNPVTGGGANRVLYEDASQNLKSEAAFAYNESTDTLTVVNLAAATGTFSSSLSGLNLEVFKTADADSPLTAAQCAGTIVSNYGMTDADCTIALPTAAAGYSFTAILPTVRARFFKFQAGSSDKIYLSGIAGADNGKVGVASGYTTGSACSLFTFKASDGNYDWFAMPISGVWIAS